MNADETDRTRLREMLLDDVALPSETVRETMFERTFASPPGAGAELLPPDGLFDLPPEGVTDDFGDGADGDRPGGANDINDPFGDDDAAASDDRPDVSHPDPDLGDPAHGGHDRSGDHGDDGVTASGDPVTDW